MKLCFNPPWFGVRESLSRPTFLSLFVFLSVGMVGLFILIPVFTVPGNTVAEQLSIFRTSDYAVVALLSVLSSLFLTMQIYVLRRRKGIAGAGVAVGGGLGALFAGVAGTAFCASCLAPFFALFGIGFGGVIFVLAYRWYFVLGMMLFMLMAICLTAREVQNVCTNC